MLIVTTDHITGKNVEMLGLVKGSTIQTVHMGKDHGLRHCSKICLKKWRRNRFFRYCAIFLFSFILSYTILNFCPPRLFTV